MTSQPTIRRANLDDAPALAVLKLASFRETFIDGFAIPYPVDLALFEHESYGVDAVRDELSNPEVATWIAEIGDAMVGYAKVSACKLPHPEVAPGAAELCQLYLLERAQGMRLGKQLMDIALAHLAAHRPGPVWLGVWSGNLKAQAFYRAYGFEKVGDYLFPVGDWRDEEFIFRRD